MSADEARDFDKQSERRKYETLVAQMICVRGVPKKDIAFSPLTIKGHLIEVKPTGLRFLGPDDYPRDPAIVDLVREWNTRDPKPMAIVLVSEFPRSLGCAVVFAETEKLWSIETRTDHEGEYYLIPKKMLRSRQALIERLLA